MFKQIASVSLIFCGVTLLSGCVSESSYVGSERQVNRRAVDNTEAARTRISLGLNYLRRGDTSQAIYNLERARAFAPELSDVYSALAFYYQTVGENQQAEQSYKQAISKDANNADAYNNYGAFLCQQGKYTEAESVLLKAISRPGYIRVAESYENLALCLLEQQQFEKAKSYLESSLLHNTTRVSAILNMATLHYAMGDHSQAKQQLDRLQRLGRISSGSTLLTYLIAEKEGDIVTQQNAEQLLLTVYPDTTETRLLLQQRLQDSEFERLREQYKASLMASLATSAVYDAAAPQPNPQLRVVRRKVAETVKTETQPAVITSEVVVQQQITEVINSTQAAEETATAVPDSETIDNAGQVVSAVAETATSEFYTTASDMKTTENAVLSETDEADAGPFHIVARGETLHTVSMRYNIRQSRLIEWNQLHEQGRIYEGQKLLLAPGILPEQNETTTRNEPIIPTENYHQVKAGETLFSISYRYNIRMDRFLHWNNLTEQSKIKEGQRLLIVAPVNTENDY